MRQFASVADTPERIGFVYEFCANTVYKLCVFVLNVFLDRSCGQNAKSQRTTCNPLAFR